MCSLGCLLTAVCARRSADLVSLQASWPGAGISKLMREPHTAQQKPLHSVDLRIQDCNSGFRYGIGEKQAK